MEIGEGVTSWHAFHKMVYSGKRRPRNSKLEKVYERVDTLASKEHTETEARIAKRFVKENWAKFPSDYENTQSEML